MNEDYDDEFEDDEDEDAHLSIFAIALREVNLNKRWRKRETGRKGTASRDVTIGGVKCSADVYLGLERNMRGFVFVDIAYQGISGKAKCETFDGCPPEFECWDYWDMAVKDLYQRSEAFRRDSGFASENDLPVSPW
jgi:hypothetical protein